jgi:prepilin-type N-terminal cleavage/methylation domain-containing protein
MLNMSIKTTRTNQGGFTLIELLVVIGILAILLAITLIALNPSKHFQGARNAQRQSDVSAILDGIYEYQAAHSGTVSTNAAAATSTPAPIAKLAAVTATGTAFSTPNLTYTVPSGNIITTAGTSVTVTGCSQSGDNGTFSVVSGTTTTIVVSDVGGSGTSATGCSIANWTGRIDLCELTPTYLADLPMDPSATAPTGGATPCAAGVTAYSTGYQIAKNSGRFTISAPSAEDSAVISVTR